MNLNFRDMDLQGADFSGSDLTNANLSDTVLAGTILSGYKPKQKSLTQRLRDMGYKPQNNT